MNALLMLEDGFYLFGKTFAGSGEVFGEAVFNTAMNGYQEIITDPSSTEQLLCFTYPHIGNYGCRPADNESSKPAAAAVIVKHYCREPQSIEATESLADMLNRNGVIGLEDLDTRTLTIHLRQKGAMRGVISTEILEPGILLEKLKKYCKKSSAESLKEISNNSPYIWKQAGRDEVAVFAPPEHSETLKEVVLLDFGVTFSMIKALNARGCLVRVLAPETSAETIKKLNPRGVFLGSGPHNPLIYEDYLPTVRSLAGWKPIMGIGMGHILLGMALGMDTYKMSFGHRGVNQPVKEVESGRVLITKQNHGYNLKKSKTMPENMEITHINLNDNTIEGIANKDLRCISTQFYPDTGFGPQHCKNIYEYFTEII